MNDLSVVHKEKVINDLIVVHKDKNEMCIIKQCVLSMSIKRM